MADVHRRGVRRGSISAPQVTIDYDRAVELRRQQSEFWGSAFGVIAFLALLLGGAVFLPALIVGYMAGSAVAGWVTAGVIVGLATLIGLVGFRGD